MVRQVREGRLAAAGLTRWRQRFFADLRARRLRLVRAVPSQEREALRLLMRHGMTIPLRTLDALQLAVALWLRDRVHLDLFVCADARLCEVARQEHLRVINPEMP